MRPTPAGVCAAAATALAACLLDPGSEDGFATCNLLDRDLRRGTDAPVLRVRSPILTPNTLVE